MLNDSGIIPNHKVITIKLIIIKSLWTDLRRGSASFYWIIVSIVNLVLQLEVISNIKSES